jgi:hypothetical protein
MIRHPRMDIVVEPGREAVITDHARHRSPNHPRERAIKSCEIISQGNFLTQKTIGAFEMETSGFEIAHF